MTAVRHQLIYWRCAEQVTNTVLHILDYYTNYFAWLCFGVWSTTDFKKYRWKIWERKLKRLRKHMAALPYLRSCRAWCQCCLLRRTPPASPSSALWQSWLPGSDTGRGRIGGEAQLARSVGKKGNVSAEAEVKETVSDVYVKGNDKQRCPVSLSNEHYCRFTALEIYLHILEK